MVYLINLSFFYSFSNLGLNKKKEKKNIHMYIYIHTFFFFSFFRKFGKNNSFQYVVNKNHIIKLLYHFIYVIYN